MEHLQFYILGLFCLAFYGQKSIDFQFDSSDSVTAGFSEISLQLCSDKKVNLVFGESVGVGQTEAGGIYRWDSDTVRGQWKIKDNLILISLDSKAGTIKETFGQTRFHARGQRIIDGKTVAFPIHADSVIIRDIPCLRVKK